MIHVKSELYVADITWRLESKIREPTCLFYPCRIGTTCSRYYMAAEIKIPILPILVATDTHQWSWRKTPTVEHAAKGPQMSRIQEKNYYSCRAGAWYFHCYDSNIEIVFWIFLAHPLFNAVTHNQKPQLGPQHVITMTKCGKMEFHTLLVWREVLHFTGIVL